MAVFTLKPSPPFRLDLTVRVLRRLALNQMDRWDGKTYRRVLVIGDAPIAVEVMQGGTVQKPELAVTTEGSRLSASRREAVVSLLQKMLGVNVDLRAFYRLATADPQLADLIAPFRGFKPPRLASVFETLLNGIACQQISMAAGMHLLNRLCVDYGLSVGDDHAFPRPVDLASTSVAHLRRIGFSERKGHTILNIARAIVEGTLDIEGLESLETPEAMERLTQLKGIGRWTAQYIMLRGLGRLDVFPGDDVGSQNKMQSWLGVTQQLDYDGMYRIISPWHPYEGIIYFYLLLNHQRQTGPPE
jgi:DNA-3-methyladenine glycosylase II